MGKSDLDTIRTSHEHQSYRLAFAGSIMATLRTISSDGTIVVETAGGAPLCCDTLEQNHAHGNILNEGDKLLVLVLDTEPARGVVLGRIGPYIPPVPRQNLVLEAAESLTLKCGSAEISLRTDGNIAVRGNDVLIRAKGTQRVRAATVAIN